jgi:hypothetical protein
MSQSYYDMTGVLCLKEVTPVIKALFGGLRLDPNYPGNGEVYFCRITDSNSQSWDDVMEKLDSLAESLGINVEDVEGEPEADRLLQALAKHFEAEKNEDLKSLIEGSTFEDDSDLDSLFVLAQAFNDGHGLKSIRYEGCWHEDKPRLWHFGGNSGLISQAVTIDGSSSGLLRMADEIAAALEKHDVQAATKSLEQHVRYLLGGIAIDATRTALKHTLAKRLLEA